MPTGPAARLSDMTTHGTPLAPGPGSPNVLIGGLPAWRAIIDQHACPAVSITGADGVGSVLLGSLTVLINNMQACRVMDIVVEKPGTVLGPVNPIVMGCVTVIIGDVGMGAPSAPSTVNVAGAGTMAPTSTPDTGGVSGDVTSSSNTFSGDDIPRNETASSTPPPPVTPHGANASKAFSLPGVSANELDLAASDKQSPAVTLARKKVAKAFYKQHNPRGLDDIAIEEHLTGIDFSKPVKARFSPPPLPDQPLQRRHLASNSRGSYYSDPGAPAGACGISPIGPSNGRYEQKVVTAHRIAAATPVLESTAAPITSKWDLFPTSTKDDAAPLKATIAEHLAQTKGGATQYYIPIND